MIIVLDAPNFRIFMVKYYGNNGLTVVVVLLVNVHDKQLKSCRMVS